MKWMLADFVMMLPAGAVLSFSNVAWWGWLAFLVTILAVSHTSYIRGRIEGARNNG